MIKPEDVKTQSISEAMQPSAVEFLNHCFSDPKIIAALVRELIAGGHCSPPVWDLKTPGHVGSFVYKTREHVERVCYPNKGEVWTIEHWKG